MKEGRGRVRRESGGRRERAEKEWHISVQSLYVFQQIHPYKNCQQHMDYTPTCTTTVISRSGREGVLNWEIRQCYCQCVVRDDGLVCTENRTHQVLVGVAVDQ